MVKNKTQNYFIFLIITITSLVIPQIHYSHIDRYPISFKVGGNFIYGHLKDEASMATPYFALTYRQNLTESKTTAFELELGTFGIKNLYNTSKSILLPLSANIVWNIKLANWLYFNPKFGGGYMLFYTISDNKSNGFTNSIFLKPGFEVTFQFTERFSMYLDGQIMAVQLLDGTGFLKEIDYYFTPNLAIRYRF